MSAVLETCLADPARTERLGQAFARALEHVRAGAPGPWTVFLHGPLGAGKTTFVRGVLRGLGHRGAVKSPTYTLVEPYELDSLSVCHLDLYRLAGGEELELVGVHDYLRPGCLCLVEWPERAGGMWSAPPDLEVRLDYAGAARRASVAGRTATGGDLLAAMRDVSHALLNV